MREIKFRAWDTKNKVMFPVISLFECGYGEVTTYWGSYYLMDCDKEDLEITQYTGLKDKNGKEIYDGDILKAQGIVAWNDVGHRWSAIDLNWNDRREWHDLEYLTSPFEIIGNIYENTELLSGN